MSISDAKTYVELEPPVVYQGGYLGHANVIPAGAHDLLGAEYVTNACAPGGLWTELCYNVDQQLCDPQTTPVPPIGGYKQFGKPELVEGSPFTVYDGTDCELARLDDALAGAEQRLSYSEGRQVDEYIYAWLDANADTNIGTLDDDIRTVIMVMEDMASQLYGSYGVIHMFRSMVLCARSRNLVFDAPGGGLETINGTKVIDVANPTPGATPQNVFLTGRVTLIQGEVNSHVVAGVNRPDGTCDPQRALAERMYVPLVECMVVKATATCEPIPAT